MKQYGNVLGQANYITKASEVNGGEDTYSYIQSIQWPDFQDHKELAYLIVPNLQTSEIV